MMRLSDLEAEEKDYLRMLTDIIGDYESQHHGMPKTVESSPDAILRWLMEVNGMKQVDLCELLHVSSGRASEIYNGKREPGKEQILKLAARFKVSPALFLPAVQSSNE